MIERRHDDGAGRTSRALYSPCLSYRYLLERRWGEGAPVLWVMLNPSTADEVRNDPTIERCERRTRAMGAGAMAIANLYAFRATRPADLFRAADPVGPATDAVLAGAAAGAAVTVCGWGIHGAKGGRGGTVEALLRRAGIRPRHLGLTKDGHPRHPLYVAYAVAPVPWDQTSGDSAMSSAVSVQSAPGGAVSVTAAAPSSATVQSVPSPDGSDATVTSGTGPSES